MSPSEASGSSEIVTASWYALTTQIELAGLVFRSAAMVGSATLAIAPSNTAIVSPSGIGRPSVGSNCWLVGPNISRPGEWQGLPLRQAPAAPPAPPARQAPGQRPGPPGPAAATHRPLAHAGPSAPDRTRARTAPPTGTRPPRSDASARYRCRP